MEKALRIIIIVCILFILGYCVRGLWIKGLIIEKKARTLSAYLDESFESLGLGPEDLARHFYEERRVGLKRFVHATKIFNLPPGIAPDNFYQAISDGVKRSKAHLIEKTDFEAGGYSISIFILGRRPISTHLIVGVKKLTDKKDAPITYKKERTNKYKVAIIIDDLGYNEKSIREIAGIKAALTLAVLPKLPFSKKAAQEGHGMGHEIILHLPLEPEEAVEYLGPGAIFLDMPPAEIEDALEEDLETVPYCRGVNNHTGSKFTVDKEKMGVLLNILKKKNLFFVDSLVASESIGFKLAKELGIPTASRDIFLDNIREEEEILKQLNKLIEIGRRTGRAIGIGHPSSITLNVLKDNLPSFQDEVEFVHVSRVLQ